MYSSVLDQVEDRGGHVLHKLASLYDAKDLFCNQSQDALEGDSSLPRTAYADDASRRFPCHTKAATCLSLLYFLDQKEHLPPAAITRIDGQFRKFAAFHNVAERMAKLRAKHAEIYGDGSAKLPDSAFALVRKHDGQIERRYPLRNALEVKEAANWLIEHRDSFAFPERQEMASRILAHADNFGAMLPETVESTLQKQAGKGWCLPQQASDLISGRLNVYAHKLATAEKAEWAKLAEGVAKDRSLILDNAKLCKLATTIDLLDQLVGAKYSEIVPRIEDRLFHLTYKEVAASRNSLCRTTTGTLYDQEQFSKLSLDAIRSALGDDVVEAVSRGLDVDTTKFATTAATLPRPDAQMLDELMQEAGQAPLAKEAQAAGLPPSVWNRLAALHNK